MSTSGWSTGAEYYTCCVYRETTVLDNAVGAIQSRAINGSPRIILPMRSNRHVLLMLEESKEVMEVRRHIEYKRTAAAGLHSHNAFSADHRFGSYSKKT